MELSFYKYQGTGNDFVMIDGRDREELAQLEPIQIAWLCHRRWGIGADGLIILVPSEKQELDFRMLYYNADGRESSMCGNGGRCVVAFAHFLEIIKENTRFEAIDGIHDATVEAEDKWVWLEMIDPKGFREIKEDHFWLDTGSPHYVQFESDNVEGVDVHHLGKEIRHSDDFAEQGGTNANFVNVLSPGSLRVRTFERGVEDETYSCGTGVVASAFAYREAHEAPVAQVSIDTKGGELKVKFDTDEEGKQHIWLGGPARQVFKGEIILPPVKDL